MNRDLYKINRLERFGLIPIKRIYYLNNVRKKGMGGARYDKVEDSRFPTHIVISADVFSRYVFRSDIAFDWDIRLEDIMLDTFLYKEDHLHNFARKHARLRFSYYPQEPTEMDNETISEYKEKLKRFDRRGHYIDGLHTIQHIPLLLTIGLSKTY